MAFDEIRRVRCSIMPLTMIHDKAHGSDPVGFQNDTAISANFPTGRSIKQIAAAIARLALAGHAMHRSDPIDGTLAYRVERCGLVRYLPTIDAAWRFLDQIGGRL